MSIQANCHILAQVNVPGVAIQVAEYKWCRGDELFEKNQRHVIRRRMTPETISVRGAMDISDVQLFGNLMFYPANVEIRTLPSESDVREQVVTGWFDPEWFYSLTGTRLECSMAELDRCYDLKNIRIDQILRWLGLETLSPSFGSSILIESLSLQVAVEITRHFMQNDSLFKVRSKSGKLNTLHLNRVIDYIESCPQKNVTLAELAELCGICSAHLRRAFKNSTGQTVHEYVSQSRLNRAKSLLSETDLPLKEVSYRVGFSASSTFSAVFRKALGETPSDFRSRTRH